MNIEIGNNLKDLLVVIIIVAGVILYNYPNICR